MRKEAIVRVQMTNDGAGSGGHEKELDFGSILKVEPTRFPQRLDVRVRREESKMLHGL